MGIYIITRYNCILFIYAIIDTFLACTEFVKEIESLNLCFNNCEHHHSSSGHGAGADVGDSVTPVTTTTTSINVNDNNINELSNNPGVRSAVRKLVDTLVSRLLDSIVNLAFPP